MASYNEDYIKGLALQRAKVLGWEDFQLQHREFTVSSNETKNIDAHTEFYYLVNAPSGTDISSGRGYYNKENPAYKDHVIEHGGSIDITNHSDIDIVVEFLQLIRTK